MMNTPKSVVLLMDGGAHFPLMMIQGLQSLGIEFCVSKTYFCLGKPLVQAAELKELKERILNCEIILRCHPHFSFYREEIDKLIESENLWSKCIIFDFSDQSEVDGFFLEKCFLYFKRVWLIGYGRAKRKETDKLHPLPFSILNEYFKVARSYNPKRAISVLTTLRRGGKRRARTNNLLHGANIPNSRIAAYTGGKRTGIFGATVKGVSKWVAYMKLMKEAKIIFTAFPNPRDGDSRCWEAMTSGALVFMDNTYIPDHPFINGEHLFYYDAASDVSTREAINIAKFYLRPENEDERIRVANAGVKFAHIHHMPKNRLEYIFSFLR